MLNLACGSRVHPDWNNFDFSPLTLLAKHMILARILRKAGILSEKRFERLLQIAPDVNRWNLRKGIRFKEGMFDVVYHSHFLEHLEREAAPVFLMECHRVLKPGGLLRVVVPDLEIIVREYLDLVNRLNEEPERPCGTGSSELHQQSIKRLFDQMVRKWPWATERQRESVGFLERMVRGDARRAGERHYWMYDYHSLFRLLVQTGFDDIRRMDAGTSQITGWNDFCLDVDSDGKTVNTRSLYVEAAK